MKTISVFLQIFMRLGLASAPALIFGDAHAAINKCVGADGKVVFSDKPCAANQRVSTIEAAKPRVPSSKTITAENLPGEGAAQANSELQQYDTLCAEDRRLLAMDAQKVNIADTIADANLQIHRARVDKRCNPEARLAAAQRDKDQHALGCKIRRDELEQLKILPERPAGYGKRSTEMASSTAWIKANCPASDER
jgi:hypothetical protein